MSLLLPTTGRAVAIEQGVEFQFAGVGAILLVVALGHIGVGVGGGVIVYAPGARAHMVAHNAAAAELHDRRHHAQRGLSDQRVIIVRAGFGRVDSGASRVVYGAFHDGRDRFAAVVGRDPGRSAICSAALEVTFIGCPFVRERPIGVIATARSARRVIRIVARVEVLGFLHFARHARACGHRFVGGLGRGRRGK